MESDQHYATSYQATTNNNSNSYPISPPLISTQPSRSYARPRRDSLPLDSELPSSSTAMSPTNSGSSSMMDRGRPKPKPRPSSFFGLEEEQAISPTLSNTVNEQEYDRAQGEFPPEETFRRGSGKEENQDPELEDRKSFYGLDSGLGGNGTANYGASNVMNGNEEIQNRYLNSNSNSSLNNELLPPLLDQSHLKPGILASLLTHEKTLDLYRTNAKKTGDADVQFEFCTFVMEVVGEMEQFGGLNMNLVVNSVEKEQAKLKQLDLVNESVNLLSKLANRGHMKSQYFLADCYTQGIGTVKGKRDFDKAFPLFVLAAKHGHVDACFRAAQCCEFGWGCRKDFSKACTFLRKAALLGHPPAMHRLGLAEMNGEIGLTKRAREGVKWLKRAAELADQVDPPQPQSLHELAILNEKGIDNIIFVDLEYAGELYARAAELGYAPSAYKLGESYEYGKMGCPQDAALSIHYYNIAAQQNHREACFALTAWYLVGSPGVLPQSDTEAYLWAKKSAEMGLAKAEYAVGYFTEVGIGTPKDAREAIDWFQKAAEHGDKRAKERLRMTSNPQEHYSPIPPTPIMASDYSNSNSKGKGKEKLSNFDKRRQSSLPLPSQPSYSSTATTNEPFSRPRTESNRRRSDMPPPPQPIVTNGYQPSLPLPPTQPMNHNRAPAPNSKLNPNSDPYAQFDQPIQSNGGYQQYDSTHPHPPAAKPSRLPPKEDEQERRNKLLSKRNRNGGAPTANGKESKEEGDGCVVC